MLNDCKKNLHLENFDGDSPMLQIQLLHFFPAVLKVLPVGRLESVGKNQVHLP